MTACCHAALLLVMLSECHDIGYCNGWFHQYCAPSLAIAHEAEVDFKMDDIDMLSRHVPCLCKVAPNTQKYHIQDVNRAGGILNILGELSKGGLLKTDVKRVDGLTLAEAVENIIYVRRKWILKQNVSIQVLRETNSI